MENLIKNKSLNNNSGTTEFDIQFKKYLLEDTLIGSTMSLYRRLKGLSLLDLSNITSLEFDRLMLIERNDLVADVWEVDSICDGIGIPFSALIINAILNEEKYEDSRRTELANIFRPIIHQLTKTHFINANDPIDKLTLSNN